MNNNVLTRAETDRELVYIWLADKSRTTQISYSSIVTGFFSFINKPLCEVQIEDLQLWHRRLQLTDRPSTVANKIRAIKSLFSYGYCWRTSQFTENEKKYRGMKLINTSFTKKIKNPLPM